jgi:hypothetical protein
VKRGLICWDRNELPPGAFEARLERLRRTLEERDLAAVAIYSDVWRSNHARYFVNVMPYWNRSVAVVPREGKPLLLCGLSPRVYPWIRSVSVLEEIRPSGNPGRQLAELAVEKKWRRIGLLEGSQWPTEIAGPLRGSETEWIDVLPAGVFEPGCDQWEIAMRRRAAEMARSILTKEMAESGKEHSLELDHHFVGRLEKSLRRTGAEDAVILLSDGSRAPAPPCGRSFREGCSVTLAVEYRGHWVRLSRFHAAPEVVESLRNRWEVLLRHLQEPSHSPCYAETLSGPLPFESCDRFALRAGDLFAFHKEFRAGEHRLFYGDTCRFGEAGAELL